MSEQYPTVPIPRMILAQQLQVADQWSFQVSIFLIQFHSGGLQWNNARPLHGAGR